MKKKIIIALMALLVLTFVCVLTACKGDGDGEGVLSIEIKTNPTKTTYQTGESLDLSGGVIAVKYKNKTVDVFMTDVSVAFSGFDSNTPGTKTVSLIYKEKSISFQVTVETAKEVKSITVKTAPKSVYTLGQDFDPSAGVLKITYDDDATGEVAMTASGVTVTGYNKNSVGTQTLTVTYKTKSDTFNITVNPPDTKTGSYTEAEIKAIYASELVGYGDNSKMYVESTPTDLKGAASAVKFTNDNYGEMATFYFYANDYYAAAKDTEFSALAADSGERWTRDGNIVVIGDSRVVAYYLTTPKLLTAAFTAQGYTVSQLAKDTKGNDCIEIKKNNVLELKIVFFDNSFMAARAHDRFIFKGGDKYNFENYEYNNDNNYRTESEALFGIDNAVPCAKTVYFGTFDAFIAMSAHLNGNS